VITVEEHTYIGGLGAMVAQIVACTEPKRVKNLSLPDEPVVTGNSKQVFDYYGLNEDGIKKAALELMKDVK
jgi:transketolase